MKATITERGPAHGKTGDVVETLPDGLLKVKVAMKGYDLMLTVRPDQVELHTETGE